MMDPLAVIILLTILGLAVWIVIDASESNGDPPEDWC
jgi:hypothetical protein